MQARERILAFVSRYPGVHEREIERRLGLSGRLAAYHLEAMAQAGEVEAFMDGQYRRYVVRPHSWTRRQLATLAGLRRPVALQVTVFLLSSGPRRHMDIARALGLAKASVSYHLALLVQAGVLEMWQAGRERIYAVRDPDAIQALLVVARPLPDDLGAFGEMWTALLGPPGNGAQA